jgi:hypothetical protein
MPCHKIYQKYAGHHLVCSEKKGKVFSFSSQAKRKAFFSVWVWCCVSFSLYSE